MDLLDRFKVKATFFVLGWIAEHYPEIVSNIHSGGHEIASHGYGHKLLYHQTEEQFEADLLLAEKFILKACGVKPIGYRAPSWSVTRELDWFHQVLGRNGYIYDSSIFPIKTFLYGIPDAPRFPFIINASNNSIIEFPSSTYHCLGRNVPFSGGFYFRALPYWLIKRFYQATNDKGHPVVFYIHPFDFDTEEPRIHGLRKRDQWIQYFGRKHSQMKLIQLLQDFQFTRVDHYINDLKNSGNINNVPLVTGLFHEKTNKP
jgi:polysaccharide deacetylase family protein (PEP-CTERM system associated)